MGSEPKTTSDHSPSPTVTELISELKTCFSSIDFQHVAKILTKREQDLLNKTHVLENEKDEILKENKKLSALLQKKDLMIQDLEQQNDGLKKKQTEIGVLEKDEIFKEKNKLNAKIENLVRENHRLKNDLGVRVLNLEKLGKELMGSEVKKAKKVVVVAESSRPLPPPGFEEIPDPKPKKGKESKHPVIIEIDDDDDDDDDEDDHGDRDLMKVSSSKRRRVSDEIEIQDSDDDDDDDKCISVMKRKNVSEKVKKDHKNTKYDDKIPTRTQPTSHSKSPFCDSSGSDSDDEKAKFSAKLDLPKGRWETEGDMVIELAKDYQLCWNAICALHKQDASQKHVVLIRPSDASRISSLSRKKTISDLSSFDRHQCRQFAMEYSAQIFDIYKEKSDAFFSAL